jgi:bifunctional DNA-binding transcriptional regulator/antitoxin component of YhaV-PrlF toxin-antitoxin module
LTYSDIYSIATIYKNMGYPIKIQKVERPTNRSYYVNLPVVLAEGVDIKKADEWEWFVEDKNTLVLSRVKKKEKRAFSKVP